MQYKADFEPMGLKLIDNDEYMARFKRNMFDKYLDFSLNYSEAKEEEIITVENMYPIPIPYVNFLNDPDFSPEKIFKPELIKEMDDYYNDILDSKKVLGVLDRGSDYSLVYKEGVKDRATVTDDRLFGKVSEFVDKHGFEAIFLATEDIDILNRFKEEFGDMVSAVI